MELTPQQHDAVNELANIAVGRSASMLSMMINRKIEIDVPVVKLISTDNLGQFFQERYSEDILGVSIGFDGEFRGTSTLIFERHQGKTLVDKLLSEQLDDDDWGGIDDSGSVDEEADLMLSDTDKEALIEMGNIMINGLMGSVSNLLQTVLNYSLPELKLKFSFSNGSGDKIETEPFNALMLETHFKDSEARIEGFLTLIFESREHIYQFLEAVDKLISVSGDENDDF